MAFEEISQKIDEPITSYYSRKAETFYSIVKEPCAKSFMYFKNHTIRGIHAPYVRQKVIEDTVSTHEELRQSMAKHVATALEGHEMNTGVISSLDGLVATTSLILDTQEEPAEIRSIQTKNCWLYKYKGHRAKQYAKKGSWVTMNVRT